MRILIYGINFAPELTGIGKYTGEMAEWLSANGHEIRVIAAPPYYPKWKVWEGYSAGKFIQEKQPNLSVFRSPLWVPRQPKTITRLLHLLSFAAFSFPILMKQLSWRPNIVICIAPAFFCTPQTLLFSKLSGCKSWLHIQDFELDAMIGLGMAGKWPRLTALAHRIELGIMRGFDRVSSISRSMVLHAENKGVSNTSLICFSNWVDTEFITPHVDHTTYRTRWGFSNDNFIVLYSGNIGKKQGLETLIETAQALQHIKRIKFVIVGEGAHLSNLLDMISTTGLNNVHFYPLQPYKELPQLLRMANLHLVIQKRGAADVVLPSKLTSILAVGGNALITADETTELGRLAQENPGIATLIEPENSEALTAAIRTAFESDTQDKDSYNQVARKYAVGKLGREAILAAFEQELFRCIEESNSST